MFRAVDSSPFIAHGTTVSRYGCSINATFYHSFLCVLWNTIRRISCAAVRFMEQKSWVRFLGLNTVLFSAIMFFYWAGTKNLDIAGFGIVQRAGFMIAWFFNLYVLNDCRNMLKA